MAGRTSACLNVAVRRALGTAPWLMALSTIAVVGIMTAPLAVAQSTAQPTTKSQGKSPARGAQKGGEDERLQKRVEQLEEQLVDMQVVIGTLESLARGGGGGSSAASIGRAAAAPEGGAYSSSEAARIDTMETQIRALSSQIEQMGAQMRAMEGRRSEAGPAATRPAGSAGLALPPAGARPAATPRFGSTTVTPSGPDDVIGGLITNNAAQPANAATVERDPLPPAIAGGDGATPKQLYETAYGYLLQRDYGAAEAAFAAFLERHPSDQLASNAQYWLGESYFVRGQYKAAASAFLKGVQTYARGAKAPDSLLKLGMSLDRLGQRDAACSSFSELQSRFPNAPSHVRNRATAERQRIRCG